jgi:hypothetical protein
MPIKGLQKPRSQSHRLLYEAKAPLVMHFGLAAVVGQASFSALEQHVVGALAVLCLAATAVRIVTHQLVATAEEVEDWRRRQR